MDTASVIRTILLLDMLALTLVAIVYLRQRRLSLTALFGWGLLALFVPVLGPFLVIANRPGQWDPDRSLAADARRGLALLRRLPPALARLLPELRRLLPEPPHPVKRLDRARQRRSARAGK